MGCSFKNEEKWGCYSPFQVKDRKMNMIWIKSLEAFWTSNIFSEFYPKSRSTQVVVSEPVHHVTHKRRYVWLVLNCSAIRWAPEIKAIEYFNIFFWNFVKISLGPNKNIFASLMKESQNFVYVASFALSCFFHSTPFFSIIFP